MSVKKNLTRLNVISYIVNWWLPKALRLFLRPVTPGQTPFSRPQWKIRDRLVPSLVYIVDSPNAFYNNMEVAASPKES